MMRGRFDVERLARCFQAQIPAPSLDRIPAVLPAAVHFPNGGVLNVSADVEQDGNASDVDQRGKMWDFTLDMETSIVDEAVQAWARETGYTIQ
jgi:hypothetical protein